jgi:hypothetical protein
MGKRGKGKGVKKEKGKWGKGEKGGKRNKGIAKYGGKGEMEERVQWKKGKNTNFGKVEGAKSLVEVEHSETSGEQSEPVLCKR